MSAGPRFSLTLGLSLAPCLLATPVARGEEKDPLPEVRARLAVEAQRVEKAYKEGRIAAYKLVRRDDPKYVEAVEKIYDLLSLVRADISLKPTRREQMILTLKADLGRIREIAGERRRWVQRSEEFARRAVVRDDVGRSEDERRGAARKARVRDVDSILGSRRRALADARDFRRHSSEATSRINRDVESSAIPESGDYVLPKDWLEKSKRRTAGPRLTAKEKRILKALDTVIKVEYKNNSFQDIIDNLEKLTGVTIVVDKKALEEAGVSYESTVSLRLKATTRSVLKRILADLGLAYVIKNEMIQITSLARAKEMTTTRAYYIGDLVAVLDPSLPPALTQAMMIQNIRRIVTMVKSIDPQSWQDNNPEAVGTVTFDPVTMTLVVKQTAEIHYMLGGLR
jgi:hypothetical protein